MYCVMRASVPSLYNVYRRYDFYHRSSKGVAEEKWDRVRVVCTQPYNKVSINHLQ